MPLTLLEAINEYAALRCVPARRAVVSWNSDSPSGRLSLRLGDDGVPFTDWLPFVVWSPSERRSMSPNADGVRIETDTILSDRPFSTVEIYAEDAALAAIALATPFAEARRASVYPGEDAHDLLVPKRSQYVAGGERGWCSAASTSMLLAYFARRLMRDDWNLDVATVAARVYDSAYGGTGNWTFNTALAGSLGLRAFVAFLRDFEHARALIRVGIPIAISFSWDAGELHDAPIEHSDGHIAVLRGFTSSGNPILNDPASPEIRVEYPREQLEPLWLRHGGVAYVFFPADRSDVVPLVEG